ncbi:Light dependent period modulator LdpA [Geitlerinema sp. FC II]|nr:Light dependent period modulator LdpA [Geitlerinema sp. FC II]
MSKLKCPLQSLQKGTWFKLICGASFQHLPAVRNLTLAYTLAGADCIDVAADPAVVEAAREGIEAAGRIAQTASPLLMASVNDAEDPHFRKAEFDPNRCPPDCSRPCERVCPADAIDRHGVADRRCYGCGRCIPICPYGFIETRSYVATPASVAPLVLSMGVDALEIHTQPGQFEDFQRLWRAVRPWVDRLKAIAVSCPDRADTLDYLRSLYRLMSPLPYPVIWQTDGRPMSGDIGKGTTKAAIEFGKKVLDSGLPGHVQLAGGTNHHTASKLKSLNLFNNSLNFEELEKKQFPKCPSAAKYIAGVAYGSYARSLLSPILEQLERRNGDSTLYLENHPDLLWSAVELARSLVSQHKPSR